MHCSVWTIVQRQKLSQYPSGNIYFYTLHECVSREFLWNSFPPFHEILNTFAIFIKFKIYLKKTPTLGKFFQFVKFKTQTWSALL